MKRIIFALLPVLALCLSCTAPSSLSSPDTPCVSEATCIEGGGSEKTFALHLAAPRALACQLTIVGARGRFIADFPPSVLGSLAQEGSQLGVAVALQNRGAGFQSPVAYLTGPSSSAEAFSIPQILCAGAEGQPLPPASGWLREVKSTDASSSTPVFAELPTVEVLGALARDMSRAAIAR